MTTKGLIHLFNDSRSVQVFDSVRARIASGESLSLEEAFEEVVEIILGESLPDLDDVTRRSLVPRVARSLLDEPSFAVRVQGLLGQNRC